MRPMSDGSDTLSDGVLWACRVAIVGVTTAVLAVVAPIVNLTSAWPLYWIGTLLSIGGVVMAAAHGSQQTTGRYGASVIAALFGVLLVGYGVEDGNILIASAGVFTVIVGVTTALLDTRELIHKDN